MEDLFREIFVEGGAAPATATQAKDAADGGVGVGGEEAPGDDGAARVWGDATEAEVGAGKVGGEAVRARGGEGPKSGSGVEGGEGQRQQQRDAASVAVGVGEKRKRELNDDEHDDRPTGDSDVSSMSDEEMQRMLSEMEVSMMMGDFDPSLVLPLDTTFGTPLDADLVSYNDHLISNDMVQSPFMDYAQGQEFGMWAGPGAGVLTGVF